VRLFKPIVEQIDKQQRSDTSRLPSMSVPPKPPIYPAPIRPPPPPLPPRPPTAPATSPQQTSPRKPEHGAATPEAQLRQLFTYVRTDCAVFYSTPHPPHF
jgi:hypothetical protein